MLPDYQVEPRAAILIAMVMAVSPPLDMKTMTWRVGQARLKEEWESALTGNTYFLILYLNLFYYYHFNFIGLSGRSIGIGVKGTHPAPPYPVPVPQFIVVPLLQALVALPHPVIQGQNHHLHIMAKVRAVVATIAEMNMGQGELQPRTSLLQKKNGSR